MVIIASFLYFASVIAILAIDILCWMYLGWQVGFAGMIGIVSFFIAYGMADEIEFSLSDYFHLSEWDVFTKKLGWAWGVGLVVFAIAYMIIAYKFGDPLEILPQNWQGFLE